MKSRNVLIGLIVIFLVGLLIYFNSNILSVIDSINEEDGTGFTCKIVKDSCDGWEDCTMERYNGEKIACINGEYVGASNDEEVVMSVSDNEIGSGGDSANE